MRSPARVRKPLLLAAAALCLGLAFAPFPFRLLALVALVPLLGVTDHAPSRRQAFFWGWLFGGLAAAWHLFWVWFLVVPVEPVTRVLLNIGVVLLFAYLGLYVGVFALVVRWLGLWSAPFVWVLLEFARSRTQIAFPWDLLGYTMTPVNPFIQPAALGGVFLVSAWVVLVNLLFYGLLVGPGRRWHLLGLVLALAGPLLYSRTVVRPTPDWFKVAIVQPNVSPLDKGDWESRERIQADLVRLTCRAAEHRPDLILFPETATLVDVTRSSTIGPVMQRLVDSLGIEVLTGTPLRDDQRGTWHNGAVLVRPGEWPPSQRHYKMRLVPFSEKIPYADELPLLKKLIGTHDMGDWARGHTFTIFQLSRARASALVCYEAIFPDLCREFVVRGAQVLANVTNDGWFGRLLGAQQHAELAVMRAVENGVPMVRSANNGISFIVDPFGRVLKRTRLFTQDVLVGDVPAARGPTLYRRFGDWFVGLSLVVLVGVLVVRRLSRRARVS